MKKTTLSTLLSNLYSATISGGIFLVTFFLLNMGLPLSLVFTGLGYVAAIFLVFPSSQQLQAARLADMLVVVLDEGEEKLKLMRSLSNDIKNNTALRSKIIEMTELGRNIFETLRKKPQYVTSVQQFSSYYLDTTIRIIKKYIELSGHSNYSPEIQHALKKVETTLDNTHLIFQKQLTQLLQDDMVNLDAEMSVLEESLELEGLELPAHDEE